MLDGFMTCVIWFDGSFIMSHSGRYSTLCS